MLTDTQIDQLIKDARKMSRELAKISRSDKDPARRAQAQRWLETDRRICEYAIECHASRGR